MSKFKEILEESQIEWRDESPKYKRGCLTSFLLTSFLLALLIVLVVLLASCQKETTEPLVCNCGDVGLKYAESGTYYTLSKNECSGEIQAVEIDSVFFFGSDSVICTSYKW